MKKIKGKGKLCVLTTKLRIIYICLLPCTFSCKYLPQPHEKEACCGRLYRAQLLNFQPGRRGGEG